MTITQTPMRLDVRIIRTPLSLHRSDLEAHYEWREVVSQHRHRHNDAVNRAIEHLESEGADVLSTDQGQRERSGADGFFGEWWSVITYDPNRD